MDSGSSQDGITNIDSVAPFSIEEIDYESLPSQASTGSHLLAGGLAGITEHSITYPLDVIKVFVACFSSINSLDSYAIVRKCFFQAIFCHYS